MSFNLFKKNKSDKNLPVESEKTEQAGKKEANEIGAVSRAADVSLVLRGTHVTEKAGSLNNLNQYVFRVASGANKIEIKKAVEKSYGVKVERVRISVVPAKKRRLGRQEGERSGFKKAMVKLADGQKIDVTPK